MIDIFKKTLEELKLKKLDVIDKDLNRPWGGFFVISEENAQDFADIYFNGLNTDSLKVSGKLSPKILLIAPNKRLSWQYHRRRCEIWKVSSGKINVITSKDNIEKNKVLLIKGDEIKIAQDERHRIIGLDEVAVIAEIWIHTDKGNPSDEDDIVRVQDDYGR